MVGRQAIPVDAETLRVALQTHGYPQVTSEMSQRFLSEAQGYAEPLLRFLGAQRIESVDASEYEKATIIHSMNDPIPDTLKGAFTCVLDGGCLEHIFNFPQAIRNCMEMVKVGGTFLSMTPSNNFMGHGFYQFSPELFYRVLSPQNGFAVKSMIVCELDPGSPQYRVKDPEAVGHRIVLANSIATYLFVMATRTHIADIFAAVPSQSDYAPLWSGKPQGEPTRAYQRGAVKSLMPYSARKFLRRFRSRPDPFDQDGFERIGSKL